MTYIQLAIAAGAEAAVILRQLTYGRSLYTPGSKLSCPRHSPGPGLEADRQFPPGRGDT